MAKSRTKIFLEESNLPDGFWDDYLEIEIECAGPPRCMKNKAQITEAQSYNSCLWCCVKYFDEGRLVHVTKPGEC